MSTQDASPDAPQSPEAPQSPNVPASPDAEEVANAPESPTGELRDLYAPESPSQKSPEVVRSRSNSPEIEEETPRKKAIIDSDDEEEEAGAASSSKKLALIDSDDDSDQEKSLPKKRLIGSDASDDEEEPEKQQKSAIFVDDSDEDEEPRRRDNSDEEREREEQMGEEEGEAPKAAVAAESDDDDDIVDRGGGGGRRGFEWDFDVMLREKKAERKRKTKRGKDSGIDIINDDDGMITHLVERMKAAAKADRNANLERKPAFQKIKLLPDVKAMMNRAGIVEALIENGFMSAISEWLAPLPDKCLPAMDIRITILKLLHNPRFWKLDRSTLKQSGLGKAVMLLYKHPNETKENKLIANKLIGEWARPIFQLDTDYSSMTKEERVVRDYQRMPEVKKKKMNINKAREEEEDSDDESDRRRPKIKETGGLGPTSSGLLKPGDDGYIPRARVPKPSTRDYVVRPKWNVEGECKDRKATGTRRYDQALRDFQERTKKSKASRSVTVSLEGRNLQI